MEQGGHGMLECSAHLECEALLIYTAGWYFGATRILKPPENLKNFV